MANLTQEKFKEICSVLYKEFLDVGLEFKVFGGAAVSVYNKKRFSNDIDIAIKKLLSEVDLVIKALENCKYSTRDRVLEEIFGADPHEESFLFSMCRVTSDNPYFLGFHIDLCFEFSDTNYESIIAKEVEVNELRIQIATPEHLLKMKEDIGIERERDKADIEFLKRYLKR